MNGDSLESNEGDEKAMILDEPREEINSAQYEEENEREREDDEEPKRMWAIVQAVLLIVATGLAGYNHYLLSQSKLNENSEVMLLESNDFQQDDECYEGGTEFQAGRDTNGNLQLDQEEITATTILCNGIQGNSGSVGPSGLDGISPSRSIINSTLLMPGNILCPAGGSNIETGLDLDKNGILDEEEVVSSHAICNGINGQSGSNGPAGSNGTDGIAGASALIKRYDAPAYLCRDGFILDFGIDDGQGNGEAFDELLDQDEVHASLKFCFSPMISERITDIVEGITNSFTTTCENGGFLHQTHQLIFAATDGINGCELYINDGTANSSHLLADINPSGESMPGKEIGFTEIQGIEEDFLIFDADDGINGREIWASNGTELGTYSLGESLMSKPVSWMNGLLLRSVEGGLLWTNGSELIPLIHHPMWNTTISTDVSNALSSLSSLGSDLLHADENSLWFNAEDVNGDNEPYLLTSEGLLTTWNLNPSTGTPFVEWVSFDNDLYAVAQRGVVNQIVHLADNGTSQWLTNLAPSSGDTHMAEILGLHRINDVLVYDARLSGSDSTIWSTNITSGFTVQLSTQILAPGITLGGIVSGHRLMFDCFTAAHGTELCVTDGSPNGTLLLSDSTPGVSSSNLVAAVALEHQWLVLASGFEGTLAHGVSLWSTDGTELTLRYNPWQGAANSSQAGNYGHLLLSATQVFFIAHDGATGHEWHRWSHGELSDDWILLNAQ